MDISQYIALIKFLLVQDIFSPNSIFVTSFSPLSSLNLQLWRKNSHIWYPIWVAFIFSLWHFKVVTNFQPMTNRFCSWRQRKIPHLSVLLCFLLVGCLVTFPYTHFALVKWKWRRIPSLNRLLWQAGLISRCDIGLHICFSIHAIKRLLDIKDKLVSKYDHLSTSCFLPQKTQGKTPGSFLRQPQPEGLQCQRLWPNVQIRSKASIQPSISKGTAFTCCWFISSHTFTLIGISFILIFIIPVQKHGTWRDDVWCIS